MTISGVRTRYNPERWSELWAEFGCDWRADVFNRQIDPPTWDAVDDVVEAGLDGILFPSQAHPGGTNLVIYRSSTRRAEELKVHDPNKALPKDQSSWIDPA